MSEPAVGRRGALLRISANIHGVEEVTIAAGSPGAYRMIHLRQRDAVDLLIRQAFSSAPAQRSRESRRTLNFPTFCGSYGGDRLPS